CELLGSEVHEHEAAPGIDPERIQAELLLPEPVGLRQERRVAEPPVEPVGPGVIWTADRSLEPPVRPGVDTVRCIIQHELRAAMPTHVVEGSESPVASSNEQDRLPRNLDPEIIAGGRQRFLPPNADPLSEPDPV